ncbi:unnamed protein product [Trichogramma brassicae]|uniref:Uncharacterized protein n=1 Tax=Trichogramma brassicae TaxID=86971 RepID=A0A6H5J125_9HYME|nr:unnamed protein product [Trichogramma brassicae]
MGDFTGGFSRISRSTVILSSSSSDACSRWSRHDHRRSLQRRVARARVTEAPDIDAFRPTPRAGRRRAGKQTGTAV